MKRTKKKEPTIRTRRYPAPMAVFPPSAPGASDLIAEIKRVFFAENPELFSLKIQRTRTDATLYIPIPETVSGPDHASYIAPRMHYVQPNPFTNTPAPADSIR